MVMKADNGTTFYNNSVEFNEDRRQRSIFSKYSFHSGSYTTNKECLQTQHC